MEDFVTRAIGLRAVEPGDGSRSRRFIASSEAVDRMGDVIVASGWQLGTFKSNPVFLWGHDRRSLPIGKISSIRVSDGNLLASVDFAPAEINPFADQVLAHYDGGFLRAVSVGFRPLAYEELTDKEGRFTGYRFTRSDLLEVSAVPVPANPEALMRGADAPSVARASASQSAATGRRLAKARATLLGLTGS